MTLEVLEHLFFPRKLFTGAHALLKPGGLLVLSTPYHGSWKNLAISLLNGWDKHFHVDQDGGHIKFFSAAALRTMADGAGFREVGFEGVGRIRGLWKAMIFAAERR